MFMVEFMLMVKGVLFILYVYRREWFNFSYIKKWCVNLWSRIGEIGYIEGKKLIMRVISCLWIIYGDRSEAVVMGF